MDGNGSYAAERAADHSTTKVGHTPANEVAIEKEIQAKGLTAPRLTPSDIDATIRDETYTVLPSGKVMVCELTLRNGFTVRGEAATVSKANFNEEIGRRISRRNAREKIWELEGYLLQERLSQSPRLRPSTPDFYDGEGQPRWRGYDPS